MKMVQRVQEISLQKQNSRVNPMPLSVTLTLSLRSKGMGYAHHLTEINIWVKFNGYGADTKFKGNTHDLEV